MLGFGIFKIGVELTRVKGFVTDRQKGEDMQVGVVEDLDVPERSQEHHHACTIYLRSCRWF